MKDMLLNGFVWIEDVLLKGLLKKIFQLMMEDLLLRDSVKKTPQ